MNVFIFWYCPTNFNQFRIDIQEFNWLGGKIPSVNRIDPFNNKSTNLDVGLLYRKLIFILA